MTVAIAFTAGTYGTYLKWCLDTLTSSENIVAPFTENGSSHGYSKKNHIQDVLKWQQFIKPSDSVNFFKFHPKITMFASISDNLKYACETAQSVIHLYPDKNSILLCINNWYTKTFDSKPFDNWQDFSTKNVFDVKLIYDNWPINRTTKINDIPRWIRREFLSFYLMPTWFDLVEWYHPDTWQHKKCCVVTVSQLLYNFENTLKKIEVFCELDYIRPISDLASYHKQNLQNQKDLNADNLCNQIINSVIEQKEFHWGELSLINESWVQWQLRNSGYEIRCHELDKFPTNSVHLKELLYTI